MDKKSVMPMFAVALLGCIAMMLSVIGGLYAYNTFLAEAPVVHAQGTDRAGKWTVTPISTQSGNQLMAVICETTNPLEQSKNTMQLAVYDIQGNNGRCDLFFVGARTLEYDFKLYDESGKNMNTKGYGPYELKKAVEKAKK